MASSTSNLDLISESQAGKATTANELFNAGSPSTLFGRRNSTSTGLTWGYYGGVVMVGATPTTIANGTLTLSASTTNYIECTSAGVISKNTVGFTGGSVPLYTVVTNASGVTPSPGYTDLRSLAFTALSGGGGGGGSVDWGTGRVYHVGQAAWMYASVQAAVTAINAASPAPSSTNRVVIQVWPGKYTTTSAITVPSYVGIKGVSKGLVQFQNNTTDMFVCSGNNWFEDFLVEGGTLSSVYAFDGNNKDKIYIRRVDMLNNGGTSVQKFLKQVGSTWKVLFIEDCIVDYYATSGYAVLLQNSGAAARYCDTVINNVFFDAYQLTGYGGSFQLKGVQDVRFRNSTIRGAATWNTGIRHELSGVSGVPEIHVRHCFLEGGVPIYTEYGTLIWLRHTLALSALFDGSAGCRHSSVNDTASITVTTADVTASGNAASVRYITTTGALTGNRNVILPSIWEGVVYNNNTDSGGPWTTTFKTSGGSGIVVAKTKRAYLIGDGTNIVRASADV